MWPLCPKARMRVVLLGVLDPDPQAAKAATLTLHLRHRDAPIMAVEATWAPPLAWMSMPLMSTIRTSSMSGGNRSLAVRILLG